MNDVNKRIGIMQWCSVIQWPEGTSLGRQDRKSLDFHGNRKNSEAGAISVVQTLKREGMGCMGEVMPSDGYVIYGYDEGDIVTATGKDLPEYVSLLKPLSGDKYIVVGRGVNYILDPNCEGSLIGTDIRIKYHTDSVLNMNA